MSKIEMLEYFICGGIGAVCHALVGHPLDTIKVRLQTIPVPEPGEEPKYTGMTDCFLKTVQHDGIRGLYRGFKANLMTIVPIFSISFMSFALGKMIFKYLGDKVIYLQYLFAGSFSGVFTTVVMAPAERVKCLLQVQGEDDDTPILYEGPIDCLRKLYREGGLANIYKGTGATLARDVPASGAYFSSYEVIKDYVTEIGAGGFAGLFFWMVGLPPDVLKSRIQTSPASNHDGMKATFSHLMEQEGAKALYKGVAPVAVKAFPTNMMCFVGFEVSLKLFRSIFGTSTGSVEMDYVAPKV